MIEHSNRSKQPSNSPSRKEPNQESQLAVHNTIAVYTVLSILVKMKNSLGLEAMLEYIQLYLDSIEKNNPRIKHAASLAIKLISVEKIYNEAVHCEKK